MGHFKDGRAGISASKNLDDNVDPISPVGFLVQDLKGLQDIRWWFPSQIYRLVTFDEYRWDHKGSTQKNWQNLETSPKPVTPPPSVHLGIQNQIQIHQDPRFYFI